MRTTLIVPDPIFKRAKAFARARHLKLSEVFSEAVAQQLAREEVATNKVAAYRLRPRKLGRPRVDINDREALFQSMEEGK